MKVSLLKYPLTLFFIAAFFIFISSFAVAEISVPDVSATALNKDQSSLLSDAITTLRKKGVIVSYRLDSAPVQFKNKYEQADGILIDIWRLWSLKSGIPVHFVGAYNKDAQKMVADGRADINAGLFASDKRRKLLDFSDPLLASAYHLFYQPTIEAINSIQDFKPFSVGVTRGSFHENYLREHYPELKLILFDGYKELFIAARNGEVDGFITQPHYLLYHLSHEQYDPQYRRLEPALYTRNYAASVKKGNESLTSVINQFLPLIHTEDRRVILQNWVGRMALNQKRNKSIQLTNEEINWLKEHPIINIGVDGDWPPYDFMDANGDHSGLSHDFMENIAEQLGIKFNPVPGPSFPKMLDKVKRGELKIAAAVTQTPERSKELWFTDSFVTVRKVIIAKKNISYFQKPEDLFGKVIAIEKGYSAVELLNKLYPEIKIQEVPTTLDALYAVSWGKADAYIGNGAVVQWLVQEHQISNIEFKGSAKLGPTPQRFAIYKDEKSKILVSIINKALANISTKQRNIMYQQWLGGTSLSQEISRNLKLTEKESDWLMKHPDIKLGIDSSWPPIEFIDQQGKYQGLSAEFMRIIAGTLNLNILAVDDLSWKEVIEKAKNKQLDILPALVKTRERSEFLNFTQSYLSFPFVIFMRNGESHTTELSDLYGKKVAIEKSYVTQEYLKRDHPDIIQLEVSNTKEALEKVSLGLADAYVGNLTVASYLISKYGMSNLKIGGTTPYQYDLSIGVRKDWPELIPILNKFLDTLSVEEKSKIRQKWLSIQYDLEVDDALINEIIIVASILLFISLLWLVYYIRKNARLVRSEEQLNTIINTLPLAVAMMDKKGTITRVNSRVSKEFNSPAENFINHKVEDFFDVPEEKEQYIASFHKQNAIHDMQVNLRKGDGSIVTGLISIIPIDLGHMHIRLGVFVNLTERIKMEQALKKAKEESDQASEFKSNFLANMSHEIRTPMNAIIGMAHLALQTELNDKQFDYITKVDYSAHHLLGLINDILDFSKIEAGMMTLEKTEFSMDTVLDNLADIVNLKASEKGLEILFRRDLSIPEVLIGDPLRLGQVLINLVQNAIKFTEQGEIVVSCELLQDKNNQTTIAFSVSDTGSGINPDQLQRLFEAFIQADSSVSRKHGGTGLGLSISKQIVELMGGQLTVSSEVGKGSVFSFTLDIDRQKFAQTKLSPIKPELQGMRVLVVDDNPVALKITSEMLESLAFDVTTSTSARQAFKLLQEHAGIDIKDASPFDLLFMDWRMPEMTGLEAINYIRSEMSLSKMPKIILVTAYARDDVMQQAETMALDGFLIKPVNPSTLFDCVMTALNKNSRIQKRNQPQAPVTRLQGKVLLTEDNSINQQIAQELLESYGLLVVIAENGQKALDYLYESDFDLVLMDIQMPVMDGFEATKIIRSEAKYDQLPIIAMTAHAMAGDKEKCLDSGMNDYLSKPIDPEKLRQMMAKWLKGDVLNQETDKALQNKEILIPENLVSIDVLWGLQRVGGNQPLFLKLLKDFNKKYVNCYAQLKQFFELDDTDEALRLVHTIHGVAGNIGAHELQDSARDIEVSIRQNNISEQHLAPLMVSFSQKSAAIFDDLDSIIHLWDEKINVHEKHLNDSNTVQSSVVDRSQIVRELNDYLLEGDAEALAAMEILKHHLNSSLSAKNEVLIEQIEQLINDYEYDEAAEILQQLVTNLNEAD